MRNIQQPKEEWLIPALGGRAEERLSEDDRIADEEMLAPIDDSVFEDSEDDVEKGLSPDFGSKQKRRKRLVRNLKRRRSYAKPVKGGTGKQARTRRNRFK